MMKARRAGSVGRCASLAGSGTGMGYVTSEVARSSMTKNLFMFSITIQYN